jgi:hypothetical protein
MHVQYIVIYQSQRAGSLSWYSVMEKSGDILASNFEKVKKACEPLIAQGSKLPLLKDTIEYNENEFAEHGILISRFERAVEIVFNIFFRIVEMTVCRSISREEGECISNMHSLGIISNQAVWLDIVSSQQSLLTYCPPSRKIQICNNIIQTYNKEMAYFLQKAEAYIHDIR